MPIDFNSLRDADGTKTVPAALDDAVTFIYDGLTDDEKEFIREGGAECFHFTIGMQLRNEWNLWGNQPDAPRTLHEYFVQNHNTSCGDDMSGAILRALQERCGYVGARAANGAAPQGRGSSAHGGAIPPRRASFLGQG